jgi:hypothetical protein
VSAAGAPLIRPFSMVAANPFPDTGIIVAWRDTRNSSEGDIYAQKINGNGIPQWVVGGMPVTTAVGVQEDPGLVSDGTGGAIIVWQDGRAGPGNSDIYAQRLSGSGLPQWIVTGMPVCDAPGDQVLPAITLTGLTGNSGAYVAWADSRGADQDIYAQWLSVDGGRQWPLNGVVVTAAPGNQTRPVINGSGPSIAWEDYRNGGDSDIYAQRLSPTGSQVWTADGVQVAGTPNASAPAIAVDQVGATYVVWQDERNGAANRDIFAQRIDFSGTLAWPTNGVTVSGAPGNQASPVVIASAFPSAIVAWEDARNGPTDLFAQRVSSSGTGLWATDGVPISTAANGQRRVRLFVPLDSGFPGAILVWEDDRNAGTGTDVYAARVAVTGVLPVTLDRFGVE